MIVLYPYENVIQYKIKKEIKEYIISKKAMKYGKIINIPIFEKELGKLIQKEGWVKVLKPQKITLILPLNYNELDKEIFTVLLNNNGIKKIKYKKEISLLDLEKNKIYLNVNENYVMLAKQEKNKMILFYPLNLFKSTDEFLNFIIKDEKKQYLIYGNKSNIIKKITERQQKNLYYYRNLKTYIISKYIP